MGKSGRKKRLKRQDFQKIKFKVGKKLPKNLNETNVAVQSKRLFVKEQLHVVSGEATTRRKLALKDLLGQVNHYNGNVRSDAVSGLLELLTEHESLVHSQLAALLEAALPLMVDKESQVRLLALKLLRLLLKSAKGMELRPFFRVLVTHAQTAQTHLVMEVRRDSLSVIDALVDHQAELLAPHCLDLIGGLVSLIASSVPSGGSHVRADVLSEWQWRKKVLKRIHDLLVVHLGHLEKATVKAQVPERCYPCSVSLVARRFQSDAASAARLPGGQEQDAFQLFSRLAPVLHDCWVDTDPDSRLDADSADGMLMMVSIHSMLLRALHLIDRQRGTQQVRTYCHQLSSQLRRLVESFPLCASGRASKRRKGVALTERALNVRLCETASLVAAYGGAECVPQASLREMAQYCLAAMEDGGDAASVDLSLRCMPRLLQACSDAGQSALCVEVLLSLLARAHPSSSECHHALALLAEMVSTGSSVLSASESRALHRRLCALPRGSLLRLLSEPSLRRHPGLVSALSQELLAGEGVVDASMSAEASSLTAGEAVHLVSLLSDVPFLPEAKYRALLSLLTRCDAAQSAAMLRCLSERVCRWMHESPQEMATFVSLLATLLFGGADDADEARIKRHVLLVESVLRSVQSLPDWKQCASALVHFAARLLPARQLQSVCSCISLLALTGLVPGVDAGTPLSALVGAAAQRIVAAATSSPPLLAAALCQQPLLKEALGHALGLHTDAS